MQTPHLSRQPGQKRYGSLKLVKHRNILSRDGQTTNRRHAFLTPTVFQLLECCDEALRKDLTRTYGALASCDEATIIYSIMTLAVRQENIMVARMTLQQMKQDHDDPLRTFPARPRGPASVGNLKINCKLLLDGRLQRCLVRIALICGLEDEEIRLIILGESKQNMTLKYALAYCTPKLKKVVKDQPVGSLKVPADCSSCS